MKVNKESDIVDKLMMKPPYYEVNSNELVEAAHLIVTLRQQILFQSVEFKALAEKVKQQEQNSKTIYEL
jgi:hypothetical protein